MSPPLADQHAIVTGGGRRRRTAGLVLVVVSSVLSVRPAGREWRETEHGSHDEGAAHH